MLIVTYKNGVKQCWEISSISSIHSKLHFVHYCSKYYATCLLTFDKFLQLISLLNFCIQNGDWWCCFSICTWNLIDLSSLPSFVCYFTLKSKRTRGTAVSTVSSQNNNPTEKLYQCLDLDLTQLTMGQGHNKFFERWANFVSGVSFIFYFRIWPGEE